MPPAFVLSQDQTLRIIKLYRRNLNLRSNFLFWFIFFDSFWIAQCKLSVTSHYSIFKQLHHDLWWFFNISQIINLSNQVLNFFQLFFNLVFFINHRSLGDMVFNVSQVFVLSNRIWKFFSIFFNLQSQVLNNHTFFWWHGS